MADIGKVPLSSVLLCACILLFGSPHIRAATEPPVRYRAKLPIIRADQFSGTQEVHLYVETNAYGYVTCAEVVSSTDSALGEICAEAVRAWRYAPAREYGQPVPARFIQPIQFSGGGRPATPGKPIPAPQISGTGKLPPGT